MPQEERIKPISYLESNAADIVKWLASNPGAIITQNGEAKMVAMGIAAYERPQETMALLKLLALGRQAFQEGKFQLVDEFFKGMDVQA